PLRPLCTPVHLVPPTRPPPPISTLFPYTTLFRSAVHVMLDILNRCFPDNMVKWQDRIKEMVPSYGISLQDHPELIKEIQDLTIRSEEHTSELQSRFDLVCRLLLEKKNINHAHDRQ